MRPSRTLLAPVFLLAAVLCVAVAVCADPTPTGTATPADTGRAADGGELMADGGPPPWNGDGDPPWAGDEPGEPESSVHPVRGRIELAISASGGLRPNAPVTLTVSGEAVERIDSGEVVLTLPTRALMDHVGEGRPDLPVKARWVLPSMVAGDTWSGSYAVPGEGAGYYRAMANAYTHGPDGGLFLFDDVVRSAWMYIHETDGQLTRWFEDSVFPEGVHPVAGPALADGAMYSSRGDSTNPILHPDSVYPDVVCTISKKVGFKPAVGAVIQGFWQGEDRRVGRSVTVPDDGIVAFGCRPGFDGRVEGEGHAPGTDLVQGRTNIVRWGINERHCGRWVQLEVEDHKYLPWRLLNLAADTLQKHFGHKRRDRIKWRINDIFNADYYNPVTDKITLVWGSENEERLHWTAAHEYGHALHHKALGGMWWKRMLATDLGCLSHTIDRLESYRCALQEGFANYAGTIGSGGYREQCFEYLGTSGDRREFMEKWCQTISHDQKPRSEAWVAALFLDLTDADTGEKGDYTEYPGRYVAEVFKSCEVRNEYKMPGLLPNVYIWWDRTNVCNIVWCLENYIHPVFHDSVFPGIRRPVDVKEKATEPPDWYRPDIRAVWLKNLK